MKINSVYKKTLFNHRKATILWGLGIIMIGLFYASIYPSIGANQDFVKAFSKAPGAVQAFIVSGKFFSSPDGFIHGEFFTATMPFILSILAIVIGSSLLAKEEESGTMELLLSRPVGRSRLLLEKFFGMVSVLFVLSVCIWLGLFLGSLLVAKFTITLSLMAVASANLGLLSLSFGCIALAFTALFGSRGLASGLTGVYFIVSYIIGTFAPQVPRLQKVEDVSLFHYFRTADILQHHAHPTDFLILIFIILAASVVSIAAFSHRDTGK